MARAEFPDSVRGAVAELRGTRRRAAWAGVLYRTLRLLGLSTENVFGTAAVLTVGTKVGDALALDAAGKVPAAMLPAVAGGRSAAKVAPKVTLGTGTGLTDVGILVAYPDTDTAVFTLRLQRGGLLQEVPITTPPIPPVLGPPAADPLAPTAAPIPATVTVIQGQAVTLEFNVSDPDTALSVSSADPTTATVTKPDDSGPSRSVRITGAGAGATHVTISVANANGANAYTVAVIVAPTTAAPLISDLATVAAVANGQTRDLAFRLSDPGASVTAVSDTVARVTVAITDSQGSERAIRLTGVSSGTATITVTATNANGANAYTVAVVSSPPVAAPILSGLPSGFSVAVGSAGIDPFTVSDAGAVIGVATADDQTATVRKVDDTGTGRSIRISGHQQGSTMVTVTAVNNGGTVTHEIAVTVTPAAPKPVFSGLPSTARVPANGLITIQFSVSDPGTLLSVTSANTALANALVADDIGATRAIYIVGAAGEQGAVDITVTGQNGGGTTSAVIAVTVTAPLPPPTIRGLNTNVRLHVGARLTDAFTVSDPDASISVNDAGGLDWQETDAEGTSRAIEYQGGYEDSGQLTVEVSNNAGTREYTVNYTVTPQPRPTISGLPSSVTLRVGRTQTIRFVLGNDPTDVHAEGQRDQTDSAFSWIDRAIAAGNGARTVRIEGFRAGRTGRVLIHADNGGGRTTATMTVRTTA